MCGSLQLSATDRLMINAGTILPRTYLRPQPRIDLPFSDHRFIRSERLDWWKTKSRMKELLLLVKGFYEKQVYYFPIPDGYAIQSIAHDALYERKIVISILTTSPELITGDENIDSIYREVSKVHHRVPVIKLVA